MGVVLISGVASGVGRATARRFAGHGWTVIGVDIKACEPLGGVELETADMSNDAEVRTLMRRIADMHGLDLRIQCEQTILERDLIHTGKRPYDIAAGLLHLQRRNRRGATNKLREGLGRLRRYEPSHHGIFVNELLGQGRRVLEDLDAGYLPYLLPPVIRFVDVESADFDR